MINVLIKISDVIDKDYLRSLKEVLSSLKKENKLSNINFEWESYRFTKLETKLIETDPNRFLDAKNPELSKSNFNSIVYIPNNSVNLKGNFLWYSRGEPPGSVMVFSSKSFIYYLSD